MQFFIFYDLDPFCQNVELCFFFQNLVIEFAKWNRKNENAEIRIPFLSILATWKKNIPNWKLQKQPLEVSCKKGVLKNVANFTGKHLCWKLLLIKLQSWGPATLVKRGSNTGVFQWYLHQVSEYIFWRTSANDSF